MPELPSTTISFTSGFLLGQASLALLLFVFIKFFIFGDPPSSATRNQARARSYSSPHNPIALSTSFSHARSSYLSSSDGRSKGSVLRPNAPLTTASVLAKTYYNVSNHQPESVDWFNVLIAQTIAQLRVDAATDEAVVSSLTSALNGPRKPSWLDEISVTEISLGEEFPIFSNCRVIPVPSSEGPGVNLGDEGRPTSRNGGEGTRLQARMDVDLSDAVTLGIETKLVLNYPRPRVAVMPVALAVSVVRFSGTVGISFIPSPASTSTDADGSGIPYTKDASNIHPTTATSDDENKKRTTPPTTLTFSFSPSYRLELSTHSLLGSRARLQDVPKIDQLVEARLHAWFDERCVSPRFQQVVLPSLWPRARNTRGGDVDVDEDRKGKGMGENDDDEEAMEEESNVVEELQMPRLRKKTSGKGRAEHPSSGFQMPGSLPDG